MRSTVTVGYFE